MPIEVKFDQAPPVRVRRQIHGGRCAFEIDGLPGEPRRVALNPFGAVLTKLK